MCRVGRPSVEVLAPWAAPATSESVSARCGRWQLSQSSELGRLRRRRVADFRLQKTAETVLLERFHRASDHVRPALASALAGRTSDPYTMAQQLVITALRKEYPNELA